MLSINKKTINQSHDWKFKVLVKEKEIGSLIDKGLHDQAVMKIAHISENTLAKHKTNILRKDYLSSLFLNASSYGTKKVNDKKINSHIFI